MTYGSESAGCVVKAVEVTVIREVCDVSKG